MHGRVAMVYVSSPYFAVSASFEGDLPCGRFGATRIYETVKMAGSSGRSVSEKIKNEVIIIALSGFKYGVFSLQQESNNAE